MSKSKLTLSVDDHIIARAKRFSRRHETTVSRLVSDFLSSLGDDEQPATPIAMRLRGVLPTDVRREDYRDHLERKHR